MVGISFALSCGIVAILVIVGIIAYTNIEVKFLEILIYTFIYGLFIPFIACWSIFCGIAIGLLIKTRSKIKKKRKTKKIKKMRGIKYG